MQYKSVILLYLFISYSTLMSSEMNSPYIYTVTQNDNEVRTYWSKFDLRFISAQSFILTEDSLNDANPNFLANQAPYLFYLRDDYFNYKCPIGGTLENNSCSIVIDSSKVRNVGDHDNYLFIEYNDGRTSCPDHFQYDTSLKVCISDIYLGTYRSLTVSTNKLTISIPTNILKTQDLNNNNRPDWNTGTLYFSNADGTIRYKCDATVTGQHNVIMTSASCVVDPNGVLYTNFMFISTQNRGTTTIAKLAFPTAYKTSQLPYKVGYDYAFLQLRNNVTPGWVGITGAWLQFQNGVNEVLATVSNTNAITAFMQVDRSPDVAQSYVFSYLQQEDAIKIPGAVMIKQYNSTGRVFGNFAFSVLSSVSNTGVAFAPIFNDVTFQIFNSVR